MIEAALEGARSMLCIGAHCDDIEIGCGGAVLKLLGANPGVHVDWVVLTSDAEREAEARSAAEAVLRGAASATISIEAYRGRFLPYVASDVKEYFDGLGARCDPDVVFTHYRDDLHQDHRLLCELTYNTFRDHLILEYEIPKYDGDVGRPNAYVCLTREQCERKVTTIIDGFPTQSGKHWFTGETFWALLRLRGIEAKSPSGYAEAFYSRKMVLR
jgi:LmbE family N-acetylglucosaminyl deacetylase